MTAECDNCAPRFWESIGRLTKHLQTLFWQPEKISLFFHRGEKWLKVAGEKPTLFTTKKRPKIPRFVSFLPFSGLDPQSYFLFPPLPTPILSFSGVLRELIPRTVPHKTEEKSSSVSLQLYTTLFSPSLSGLNRGAPIEVKGENRVRASLKALQARAWLLTVALVKVFADNARRLLSSIIKRLGAYFMLGFSACHFYLFPSVYTSKTVRLISLLKKGLRAFRRQHALQI